MAALQYLKSLRNDHAELSDWCNTLADLYQRKLWHQHSLKLEQFVALAVFQKSGLHDLSTSKTPEASNSIALSRDPVLFERIAPSTYNVRLAFRKDPTDADAIIAAAKEKIQRYANRFLGGQNVEDEERDDDSEGECDVVEGPECDDLGTPYGANKNGEQCSVLDPFLVN